MDHSRLLNSTPRELALYLRATAASLSTAAVTRDLLARTENGSIPPVVFAAWCSASGDAAVLHAGLSQDFSRRIQRVAIIRFGKLMRGPYPDLVWEAVGGTEGILSFLSGASVCHVKLFCKELGHSGSSSKAVEKRQSLVDHLAQVLFRQPSNGIALQMSDDRPLRKYYLPLLSACSSPARRAILGSDDLAYASMGSRRKRLLSALAEHSSDSNGLDNILTLLDDNGSEPRPPAQERLSSNMHFVMDLLDTLSRIDQPVHATSRHVFYDKVVLPLFQRIARWKTSPQNVASAVRSLIKLHQRHGLASSRVMSLSQGSVIRYFIRRWERHPDELDESLKSLLTVVPHITDHARTSRDLSDLVSNVPRLLRVRLLQLGLRHVKMFGSDINSNEDIRSLRFEWSPSLFLDLPGDFSRQLFTMVINAKPANSWTNWSTQSRSLRMQHRGDPTCLRLMLMKDEPASLVVAQDVVNERKRNAEKARAQPDRAFWAQCALDCSIASGSLDLYRDTLHWAIRFRKDPLTVKEIYSKQSLHTQQGIHLLSGFGRCQLPDSQSLDSTKQRIKIGNQVCRELHQSASEALKEPSFNPAHWEAILSIFKHVLSSRIEYAPFLQSQLSLTDEELYDTVFKDTLECAIDLELLRIAEPSRRLGPNLYGPAGGCHQITNQAVLRFANELAKRRHDLWERHRAQEHPATLNLSDAYPRGLPLQVESIIDPSEAISSPSGTFILTRAEQIVFMKPELALAAAPENEDLQDAIGVFVDGWEFALQTYISLSAHPQESAITAWEYSLGALSQPRMSAMEAYVFWAPKFREAIGSRDINGPWKEEFLDKLPALEIPSVEEDGTIEWDPDSELGQYRVKDRRLDPTNLDAILNAQQHFSSNSNTRWRTVDVLIPGVRDLSNPWQRYIGRQKAHPSAREALICSAIAFLSEEITHASDILSKPFPSSKVGRMRFPGLYLDDDFLKRNQGNAGHALQTLQWLNGDVPSIMLHDIVSLAFKKADASGDAPSRFTFELLKLLVDGDRPQLALDLLQHLVLDRPSDSAWQRTLFSQQTMNKLPSNTARLFLDALSKGIQERLLQVKAERASGEKSPDADSSPKAPSVKVTTVKMLAQFLAGATFVDEKTTVHILSDLLSTVTHHDIRVAVAQAMLQILVNTSSPNVRDTMLGCLQEYAVPIMANMNERQPVSEAQWQDCERDLVDFPEASINHDQLPPMLSTVIAYTNSGSMEDEVRQQLFEKVLLPTLNGSVLEHARWIKCLSHVTDVTTASIPDCPVHPMLLSGLLDNVEFAPAYVLDLWLGVFKLRQIPPQEVKVLNALTKDYREGFSRKAGDHWRSYWEGVQALAHRSKPIQLLKKEFTNKVPNGISYEKLQQIWLKQTDITLRRNDIAFDHQNSLLHDLSPPPLTRKHEVAHWTKYRRPLVQALVLRIEAIRTPAWQRNPNRTPNLLPDLTAPKRWLLLFPETPPASILDHTYSVTVSLLTDLSTSQRPYADPYRRLMAQLKEMGLENSVKLHLAVRLGRSPEDKEDLSLADRLCVACATELLQLGGDALRNEKGKVLELLRFWIGHVDEDIRIAGRQCAEDLKRQVVGGVRALDGSEEGIF